MKLVIPVLFFSLVHAMAFNQDLLENLDLRFDSPPNVASPDKPGLATALNRDSGTQNLKKYKGVNSLLISREHLRWIFEQLKSLGDVNVQNHQNSKLSRVASNDEKGKFCSSQSCLRAVFWRNEPDVKVPKHKNLEPSRVNLNDEKMFYCSSQSCLRAVFWKNEPDVKV